MREKRLLDVFMRNDQIYGQRERGFTLIELILVIIVLAILGAVVSIGINSLSTIRLNNAVGKVVADLRYAQQMAATTRSRHGITIDPALQQQYSVRADCGIDGVCGNADDTAQTAGVDTLIQDPTNLGNTFVVNFGTYQQGQLAGVQFNSLTPFCPAGCGACQATLEFNGRGAPTDTGGVEWPCDVTVVLTHSGAADQTITITANTGKVSG